MPLRVAFRVLHGPIGQTPIVEMSLWGDTVENRTLGMVNAGGKAAASHAACLLYTHLRTSPHASWTCVRVRAHFPLPLEKGSKRLWHGRNSSNPYQRVSRRSPVFPLTCTSSPFPGRRKAKPAGSRPVPSLPFPCAHRGSPGSRRPLPGQQDTAPRPSRRRDKRGALRGPAGSAVRAEERGARPRSPAERSRAAAPGRRSRCPCPALTCAAGRSAPSPGPPGSWWRAAGCCTCPPRTWPGPRQRQRLRGPRAGGSPPAPPRRPRPPLPGPGGAAPRGAGEARLLLRGLRRGTGWFLSGACKPWKPDFQINAVKQFLAAAVDFLFFLHAQLRLCEKIVFPRVFSCWSK